MDQYKTFLDLYIKANPSMKKQLQYENAQKVTVIPNIIVAIVAERRNDKIFNIKYKIVLKHIF